MQELINDDEDAKAAMRSVLDDRCQDKGNLLLFPSPVAEMVLCNGSVRAKPNGRATRPFPNRNGTFTDVTKASGTGGSGWSTSAAWIDLDNDGLLDLVVLRYVDWNFVDLYCGEHEEGHRSYCHPDHFAAVPPLVYHNDGHGHFTEVAEKAGLSKPGKSLGLAIADYDRDGHLDIAIANDSMPEFLYRNKGDGTFEEVGLLSSIAVDGDGHTYAGMGIDFADYNNDGLPD